MTREEFVKQRCEIEAIEPILIKMEDILKEVSE